MSILVKSSTPERLEKALCDAVLSGPFDWMADRGMLTSTDPALTMQAWFRVDLHEGGLLFRVVPPSGETVPPAIYALYHALMVETLLGRFNVLLDRITLIPGGEGVRKVN